MGCTWKCLATKYWLIASWKLILIYSCIFFVFFFFLLVDQFWSIAEVEWISLQLWQSMEKLKLFLFLREDAVWLEREKSSSWMKDLLHWTEHLLGPFLNERIQVNQTLAFLSLIRTPRGNEEPVHVHYCNAWTVLKTQRGPEKNLPELRK